MTQKKNLKLIYFKMRALAEPPQLLLKYANIEYSYLMSWEYFGKPWNEVKSKIVFSQLPLLVVDNVNKIAQSGSIIRYLAKIANMLPKDDRLAAKVDSIFETAHEMFFPLNPTINFAVGSAFEESKNTILASVKNRLTNFETLLNENLDGPFFLGKIPFYCDFGVYHHMSLLRKLDNNIFNNYIKIQQFMEEIEAIDAVGEYLKSRPKLIGVGIKPQLIINGTKCNTGVTVD